MAARPFRNVTLSLGLVNAPVCVFPATVNTKINFELADTDGQPVEQVYRRTDNQKVVGGRDDCARTFEGRLVDKQKIERIKEEGKTEDDVALNKTLSIKQFIPLKSVPFDRVTGCYNLANNPKGGSPKGLATIIKAMEKKKMAGVCKWVPTSEQTMAVIYVENHRLRLVTLRFADEVAEIPQDVPTDEAKIDSQELDIACQIIDAYSDEDAKILTELSNTATAAKLALIEQILQGKPVEPLPAVAESATGDATPLLDALQASLKEKLREASAA